MIKENESKDIVVYQAEDAEVSFKVNVFEETVWLTQKQISELFQVGIPNINEHLKNIFSDQECKETATIRNFRIVQKEGNRSVKREIEHYNLDIIICRLSN